VGTAVTFVNQAQNQNIWIASNPYPANSDLPGFNSGKGLKFGESYTYVFNQLGNWGYHNDLNYNVGGTIRVVTQF